MPHRVEYASIAGSDLVYIDEFGLVHTISAVINADTNQNELRLSRMLDLPTKAIKASVGFAHGFGLTENNEVYTWIL